MAFKIYTRGGDTGETSLYGGDRAPKDNPRVEAYGTVDELNAALGVLIAELPADPAAALPRACDATFLRSIQAELFTLGGELATPPERELATDPLPSAAVDRLEAAIDVLDADLSPLTNFILPGGARVAAAAQLCRTVARRAERRVVQLDHASPLRGVGIVYLNRLSDYLFVAARTLNAHAGVEDVVWAPRG